MNNLTIPTVEQINLEYRLSQSKASEAVQHAIICGLMLLQVKASLAHGQWLPWLKAQQDEGAVEFTGRTARDYMRIASNWQHAANLPSAPSIRAALELLADDKDEPPAQEGMDLTTAKEAAARAEAEAKAAAAAEAETIAKAREQEWRAQALAEKRRREEAETAASLKANELRKLQGSVEQSANRLAAQQLAPVTAELEQARIDKAELAGKLKQLRKEQDAAVETRTKQALQAQQDEIDRREAQLRAVEGRIEVLNARLNAVANEDRVASHFQEVTREIRAAMDALSLHLMHAFDGDFADHLPAEFVPVFRRLANELDEGAASVRRVLGTVEIRKPELVVNHG